MVVYYPAWIKVLNFKYSGNTNIDSLIERDNTNINSNSLYIE